MIYENIMDMHSHTNHSFDGNYPVDELCEVCIQRGIKAVAFTDHIEMDIFRERGFDKTATESFADVSRAKNKYAGQLEVVVGIEMGQPCYDLKETEALIEEIPFDYIIGSVHNLRNKDDFSLLDYNKMDMKTIDRLFREYLYEEKLMADWAKFDTFAHLAYPLRYMIGEYGVKIDIFDYKSDVDEILSILAEKDKPLEINTSGLRQKIGKTLPDEKVVKRFKELGGRYITVGSDSHYTEHMGAGICDGYDLAKQCGFDSVLIFRNHRPFEVPIK